MVTKIFHCLFILRQVREGLKKDVEQMKVQNPNFSPGLVVLQVSMRLISQYCHTYFVEVNLYFLCRLETAMTQICTSV